MRISCRPARFFHPVCLCLSALAPGLACEPGASSQDHAQSSAASTPASSAVVSALAAAGGGPQPSAATSASAAAKPAPAPALRCKAAGADKLIKLGAGKGAFHGMTVGPSHIYLMVFKSGPLKGELLRFAKDGSASTVLAVLEGLGDPTDVEVDASGVYFAKGRNLYRSEPGSTTPKLLAESFGTKLALWGEHVYAVDYDRETKSDRLQRVAKAGSEVETLVARKRQRTNSPSAYTSLAVDKAGVYVTDAGKWRVLQVAHKGGEPTELASGMVPANFADNVTTDDGAVYWSTHDTLLRLDRGAEKPQVLEKGLALWRLVTADASNLYLYNPVYLGGGENEAATWVVRVPKRDGKPERIESLRTNVYGMGVDSDCLYFARHEVIHYKPYLTYVQARGKAK